jgi:hypothetical protein
MSEQHSEEQLAMGCDFPLANSKELQPLVKDPYAYAEIVGAAAEAIVSADPAAVFYMTSF